MKAELAIKKSLEKDVVLFVSPHEKYDQFLEKIISTHIKKKKLGLVSLNKSYSNFSKELKKKKINADKISFIDCVSQKEGGKIEKRENVFYVSSPQAYTEINIATKNALKDEVEDVIFDSLSKLLTYGNHAIVYRYIQDLIMFVRNNKKKIFFILLENDYDKNIVEQIQEIVDKVIVLGEVSSLAKNDAVKLMGKLFGPNASKMVKSSTLKKGPELLLHDFEAILSKLVGPENARKQLEELYKKYV